MSLSTSGRVFARVRSLAFLSWMAVAVGVLFGGAAGVSPSVMRADPSPPYYGPAVLGTHNLVGYWPLDETSGTTAHDDATSPANGTYVTPGVTLGQSGAVQTSTDYAVKFDGANGHVSVPAVSKLQPTSSASLEAWFNSAVGTSGIQPILQSGGTSGLRLYLASGKVEGVVDGVGVLSANTYNNGAWHYAVMTWDGSKISLYVDGALVKPSGAFANPQAETSAPSYGSTGVLVGENTSTNFYNGSIDEPAIYGSSTNASGALSAGEVANHYAAALSGPVSTPSDVVPPTVSGRPLVGSSLSVTDNGSWNSSTELYGTLSFSYQWLRCGFDGVGCASIAGATASIYTVAVADTSHSVAVRVTATSSGGSGSATVVLPAVGGYRSAVFGDGGSDLRGYWPLDETFLSAYQQQASDLADSPAPGAYHSDTSTSVQLQQPAAIDGPNYYAATFNGVDGYISVPTASKLLPSKSATLEAWFKSSAGGSTVQPILQSGGASGLRLRLASGKASAVVDGVQIMSASTYNDGKWHYAAMTWDGSKIWLYVDGVLVAPATGYSNPQPETVAPSYDSSGVLIGKDSTPFYFNGSIDEPALYGSSTDSSGALTATEVSNHFQLAAFRSAPASWIRGGSNAAAPGSCNCVQNAGDPVNTANGDFSETTTDASLASFGPSVSFSRTYDASLAQAQAAAGTPGVLGYGWTDNWNASLSVSSGVVTITQGNGAQVTFYPPVSGACPAPYVGPGTSGTYCALPEVTASLTYSSVSSTYTFVTHPFQSYTFDSSGRLTGEAGPGGAALTVAYNTPAPGSGGCPAAASSCTKITSASGRALVLAKNSAGLITNVVDPLGRTWTYGYCSPPSSTCSANDLISVTDPMSRVTSFTYDQGNATSSLKHDLLTVTKPNGQTGGPNAGAELSNVYDTSGRVSSQTDPSGYQTTFDYSHLNTASGGGYVVVTDPDGNKTQYSYDGGALVSTVSGYTSLTAATTGYEPDPSTLLDDTVVDANGNPTSYGYNATGTVSSSTDAQGNTATYTYNSFDEPTCSASALAASPCSSLSPPAPITPGGTISPPSAAPPKYVSFSAYDTNGNLVWTTVGDYNPGSSSASQQRTTYNLYNGESVTIGSNTDSCTASAPASSLPCATIDANGVVTQLGYSSAGDLTSSSTPDGNSGGEVAVTTHGYDGDGERTSATTPNGNLTGANSADFTTTTAYDDDGEVTSVTVGHTGGGLTARVTSYGYDGNGNRTSATNPRNKQTTYTFNADDQLTLVADPDGQSTLTCYDGDGNVAQTVPPVGVAANSLTPASCPTSYPSSYGNRLATDATSNTYNALNQKTTVTTPSPAGQTGYETTSYVYDGAGQLTSVTAPPTSNTTGAPNQVTTYSYDDVGQLLTVTVGAGTSAASTTSYCYDPLGEKTATVPPDGNTSTVASCSTSAPYQTSSALQTGYSYDSLGELVSRTRPATTWASSGQTTSYSYDPAGNLLTSTDPNGVTTTNTYTPLNQLATVSYSGSSAHSVSYSYDANGNRLTMSDATGSSSYGYNPFNELTSYQNGAGNLVNYGYNDDGKTTSISYPLGSPSWATSNNVSYGYDNADELNSITDFNGNSITVGNTADGLPNSLTLGSSGDTVSTSYDPTDTASQITLGNGTSTLLQFAYSDVPSGAISAETDTPSWSGSPASYTYDPQSRVTQMTPGSGSALNYGFDASGNPTTLPTGANGSYDNASELTSSALSGTSTSYTFDADGQRTQASQGGTTIASATYNGAQRLTAYSNSAANMSTATYDGDGLRQSTTTTPAGGTATTENFTWDTSGALPQLLVDSDSAYIYGVGNTPIEQVNLSTGSIKYLVADSLGSVRGIVNTSGTLLASTAYDAWGNPETTGGLSSSTPFGYAGSYTDNTGLSYLLHRYYDPMSGQFLTVDPVVDQTEAAYGYAAENPINETDASGLCAGPGLGQGLLSSARTARSLLAAVAGSEAPDAAPLSYIAPLHIKPQAPLHIKPHRSKPSGEEPEDPFGEGVECLNEGEVIQTLDGRWLVCEDGKWKEIANPTEGDPFWFKPLPMPLRQPPTVPPSPWGRMSL